MNPNNAHRAEQADPDARIARFQTEREALWHALATQHLQRLRVIKLLEAIDAKLSALLDLALRKGGRP